MIPLGESFVQGERFWVRPVVLHVRLDKSAVMKIEKVASALAEKIIVT